MCLEKKSFSAACRCPQPVFRHRRLVMPIRRRFRIEAPYGSQHDFLLRRVNSTTEKPAVGTNSELLAGSSQRKTRFSRKSESKTQQPRQIRIYFSGRMAREEKNPQPSWVRTPDTEERQRPRTERSHPYLTTQPVKCSVAHTLFRHRKGIMASVGTPPNGAKELEEVVQGQAKKSFPVRFRRLERCAEIQLFSHETA